MLLTKGKTINVIATKRLNEKYYLKIFLGNKITWWIKKIVVEDLPVFQSKGEVCSFLFHPQNYTYFKIPYDVLEYVCTLYIPVLLNQDRYINLLKHLPFLCDKIFKNLF